jgi:hypothetical protein
MKELENRKRKRKRRRRDEKNIKWPGEPLRPSK